METIIPKIQQRAATTLPRFLHWLLRKQLLRALKNLPWGNIVILEGNERFTPGNSEKNYGPQAIITVHDPYFYTYVSFGGSVGAGQAYFLGLWDTDNLTNLMRILARNRDRLDKLETGFARISGPLYKFFHRRRENNQEGSRKNISAHYDLGNNFFGLFLDPTMMYSSAIFPNEQTSLEEAQIARLDHICRKLELSQHDRVIEIGTGWGGFALHAARNYGAYVTTTTISREQYEHARLRVREAGLEDRITVLCKDYRELEGQYDKLVSIEMIEAVGHKYYDTFFKKCSTLLEPNGQMLLQAITIEDHRYERAKRNVDFIQRFIFPGSCIPSVAAMMDSVARATDLHLFHLEDIGPHYATTLRHWRERFTANSEKIRKLGFSGEFMRMWEFYLCYCEGGFAERAIGDAHLLLTKPLCRRAPLLVNITPAP